MSAHKSNQIKSNQIKSWVPIKKNKKISAHTQSWVVLFFGWGQLFGVIPRRVPGEQKQNFVQQLQRPLQKDLMDPEDNGAANLFSSLLLLALPVFVANLASAIMI